MGADGADGTNVPTDRVAKDRELTEEELDARVREAFGAIR